MANKYVAIAENFFRTFCRNNFHEFAAKCRVVDASEGHVRVEFDVSKEHTNPLGTLHGGCTATLIDTVTTTTLFTTTHNAPGVSIDLSVSYLSPARIGDTIILDAVVLKLGKNLAFTRADVYRKGDNTLLAYGMQSMALVKNWEQFDKGKI